MPPRPSSPSAIPPSIGSAFKNLTPTSTPSVSFHKSVSSSSPPLGAESLTRVPFHKSVPSSSPPLRGAGLDFFTQLAPQMQQAAPQMQPDMVVSQSGSSYGVQRGMYETEQIRNSTITLLMEENKV